MGNSYKWQLLLLRENKGQKCFLSPIPDMEPVDSRYLHKPGDIDYSNLSILSNKEKADILYWILLGHVYEQPMECAAEVASVVIVDRLTNPEFLPEELNPKNWKW